MEKNAVATLLLSHCSFAVVVSVVASICKWFSRVREVAQSVACVPFEFLH